MGWLDKYDKPEKAQKGYKIKDERALTQRKAESTGVKKINAALDLKRKIQAEDKAIRDYKKLTPEQKERQAYEEYNRQHGAISKYTPESGFERAKQIAINPLTAAGYIARGENLPGRFQEGPRNTLDYAVDWINPVQGVAAASQVPGQLAEGDFTGAGLSVLDALDLAPYVKGAGKIVGKYAPRFGKTPEKVVHQLGDVGDIEENPFHHSRLDWEDLEEIKAKHEPEFVRQFGKNYEDKDLGAFAKMQEINEQRLLDPYEDPDIFRTTAGDLASNERARFSKEVTDAFLKKHGLENITYNPKETLLADMFSHGYDNYFSGRPGFANYMKKLYDPMREDFQKLVTKSKTTVPERFFRESEDYMLENVWDPQGNKVDPRLFSELEEGFEYIPPGYQSTTLVPSNVNFGPILSNISVPVGQSFLNINATKNRTFFNELENVLPPDLRYRIDKVHRGDYRPMQSKYYNTLYEKSIVNPYKHGGVIDDDMGQWAHPGEVTRINSNNITMEGVDYPVFGVSDKGDSKLMLPGKNYKFKGKSVTEYPLKKAQKGITTDKYISYNDVPNKNINFAKANAGKGWLDKYE